MDITEVPPNQDIHGKKKKNKKPRKKCISQEETGEGSGIERKEEEKKMEKSEPAATAFPPTFSVSEIKNKQRRHLMFMKFKQEKRKVTLNTETNST